MSILKTKIQIPPLRDNRVKRPDLINRIEQGIENGARLTLLSALAGAGKTTLLTEWANTYKHPVVWVSLDGIENDPVYIWQHIITAIETRHPKLAASAVPLLHGGGASIRGAINALVNDLAESDTLLFLVLDDYHLVRAQEMHDSLTYLLNNQPENFHLLITSRADPPLPLARLRARGQLTELRGLDLRFTYDEIARFFGAVVSLNLNENQLQTLAARTEGWAAGLYLAGLSLQSTNTETFFADLRKTDRFILEYLTEEVLSQQPEEIQQFLLQTSILDEFNAVICDALLEQNNSGTLIEDLLRMNLFIQDMGGVYRYHGLFADLLRIKLKSQYSVTHIQALYSHVVSWCEANDQAHKAVHYALQIPDYATAADLIEHHSYNMTYSGQLGLLYTWVKDFPEEILDSRPMLRFLMAVYVLIKGQPAYAEHLLQIALAHSHDETLSKEIKSQLILSFIHQGKAEVALSLVDELLSGQPDSQMRITGKKVLALSYLGRLKEALEHTELDPQISREPNYHVTEIQIRQERADLFMHLGALKQSDFIHRQIIEESLHNPSINQPFFLAASSYVGLAMLLTEMNQLKEASSMLERGIAQGEQAQWPDAVQRGYLVEAHITYARGDIAQAFALIKTHEPALRTANHPRVHLWMLVRWVQYSLKLGDFETAFYAYQQILEHRMQNPPDLEIQQLTGAWLDLSNGDYQNAVYRCLPLLNGESQFVYHKLLAANTCALAHYEMGDMDKAEALLVKALETALTCGYRRVFLDEGELMVRLLSALARRKSIAEDVLSFVESLLNTVGKSANEETSLLTEREQEIMVLIAQGLANKEIAAQLFVTVHTVKKHTTAIYEKLNVMSRTQAILRAQELHLI